MVVELVLVSVIGGAVSPTVGRILTKKSVKLPFIGRVSPAVLGALIVAIAGLGAYYFKDKIHLSEQWAHRAMLVGVAALGAFSAVVIAPHVRKMAEEFAEDTDMDEEMEFQATRVPEERVAEYSRFTGAGNPLLAPTYYVTVKD